MTGWGQHLTGVACLSKVLQQRLQAAGSIGVSECGQVVDLVDQAIQQARDLARGLYPAELETHGLLLSLTTFAATAEQVYESFVPGGTTDIRSRNRTSGHRFSSTASPRKRLATPSSTALHRIIVIGLRPASSGFELSVEDDGIGIGEGAERSGGLGLSIMRYRAESIGAQLEIGGRQDKGTTVLCRVPAHAKHNASND